MPCAKRLKISGVRSDLLAKNNAHRELYVTKGANPAKINCISEEKIMTDERKIEQAKLTYNTLCNMLDGIGWSYEKDEEKLLIRSGVKSEDLPIKFTIRVRPGNQIVSFSSWMPYEVPENKRVDVALAIHAVNYKLIDGSFDYDLSDGSIMFRLTSSFRESILGKELFEYMIMVSTTVVDEYNDKFFAVAKGLMSLEQFIEQINK